MRTLLCGAVVGSAAGAATGAVLWRFVAVALPDKILWALVAGASVAVLWWAVGVLRAGLRFVGRVRYRRKIRRWRRRELAASSAIRAREDEITSPLDRPSRSRPDPVRNARLLRDAGEAVGRSDFQQAIQRLSELIDAAPAHCEAHLTRGRIYRDLGDFDRAMSDLTRAEILAPYSSDPLIAMGELCFARKDYARAIGYYDVALALDPDDALTYTRRGLGHSYRKNHPLALEDFRRARALDPDTPNVAAHVAMAEKKVAAAAR